MKKTTSRLHQISDPVLEQFEVSLFILREDQNHPLLSGNKLRKMKYNLLKAEQEGHKTLLTLGGAYSNHIHATAAAGNLFGLNTIGIIRGEPTKPLNPTLTFARKQGMVLHYVKRDSYRERYNQDFKAALHRQFGSFYFLPEGGSNELAIPGCREMVEEIEQDFDYICTPVGSGGTLAGIISGLKPHQFAIGFVVLKQGEYLKEQIIQLRSSAGEKTADNWQLSHDYHFNGFARFNDSLIRFINNFKACHSIQLEPIYSGKMLFGVWDLIKKGYFKPGSRIVAVHTGGLQALEGFRLRFGKLIK